MIVTGWDGGVRIELDETEAHELAEFVRDFFDPSQVSIAEILSARLDDVLGIERK